MFDRGKLKAWAQERFFEEEGITSVIKNWKRLALALVLFIILLVFFGQYIRFITTVVVLIAIGFASMLYNRVLRISLGVEFILLVTVLAGYKYNPLVAFFVGAVALFSIEVFNSSFQHSTIVSFFGLGVVSLAIPLFADSSITVVGISMALLYNLVIAPGYFVLGSEPWKTVLFVVSDIIFNIWVFIVIAPRLVGLIG